MHMESTSPLTVTKARSDHKADGQSRENHGSGKIFDETMTCDPTRDSNAQRNESPVQVSDMSDVEGGEVKADEPDVERDADAMALSASTQEQVTDTNIEERVLGVSKDGALHLYRQFSDDAPRDDCSNPVETEMDANKSSTLLSEAIQTDNPSAVEMRQTADLGKFSASANPEKTEVLRPQPGSSLVGDVRNDPRNGSQISLDSASTDRDGGGEHGALGEHADFQGESIVDFDALLVSSPTPRHELSGHGATVTTDVRSKNLFSQIAVQVSQSESGDLDVHLAPEELGVLKISVSKGDRTTLIIYAERSDTLDLLRRNADSLVKELRESGLSEFSLEFRHNDSPSEDKQRRLATLSPANLSEGSDGFEPSGSNFLMTPSPLLRSTSGLENIDIRL